MKYKSTDESKMKQSLIQLVLDECERETAHFQSSFASVATQSKGTKTIKKSKLFQYINTPPSDTTQALDPAAELTAYLTDPIQSQFSPFWSKTSLPVLKRVVIRVLSIQASSAPIERVFSQAGLIMSPRRTSMREDSFRSLVFLRANQHIL
ncbi:unnamed protein product [Didymodactylos carnosus]|uniref:HAT C-terminal dimerisation domain-containing protein n=1 Tax=Didymodactylos carnosus TaxID=1234261 RepID=A0A8S2F3B2_9BILA|nr:unnamed protein product [Didymodactylos carnosus]CAF4192498.1 unnamed protein product [Didymodactylos carnosus]